MEIDQALLKYKSFAEISTEDLQYIVEKFHKRQFKQGDILVQTGKPADGIGILCAGSAAAFLDHQTEKLYDLNESNFYGVPELLKMRHSTSTIVCNQPVVTYFLGIDEFFKIIARFPSIRAFFYHLSMEKAYTIENKKNSRLPLEKASVDDKAKYPACIQKALGYINANFTSQISLETVAYESGVSKFYLSRLLKESTGLSFKQHLTRRRLNEAKRLMGKRAMNVSEACYASGFNNLSHFVRLFKQYENIRPSDYRRKLGPQIL